MVMDQADYKKKIENLLEDPVYQKISKDPTSATERKIRPYLVDFLIHEYSSLKKWVGRSKYIYICNYESH